jgi:hypothetical protein
MPSGERYRATLTIRKEIRKFDLSPEQFELLSKKSFKIPTYPDWNTEQRVKGLVKYRLFVKQPRSYQRTSVGEMVYKHITERINNKNHF